MSDEETRHLIVSQPAGAAFALAGSDRHDPLSHRVQADFVHRTDKPMVHMHLWDDDCACKLEHEVRFDAGPDKPVNLAHRFPDTHAQSHEMKTALDAPIHHALQMRTPLQVRFCNTWQVASDYTVSVGLRGKPFLDIRLTGATVATPKPCDDDCAPAPQVAVHP
ncbi:hypothetical protein [Rhodobacter ferrooxidans]|uniref:Uncharacterized protein n=1 Tax=Rhodobacter ferrooxidans TaxID=371731 RepID=C8RYX3_9RHOB|nr:hypothetical protein [Rhodobacter sp. SW2]EEW25930.1 hypothetical protein Rsw2DRAFT_1001 [Rhodobacter sp. SW2]